METALTDRAARVNQVLKWVLSGSTEYDVREAIGATFPNDEAGGLLLEVMQSLEKSSRFNQAVVVGWCFEACRDLYAKMVETKDYQGALRALKQLLEIAKHVPNDDTEEEGGSTRAPEGTGTTAPA